MVNRLRHSMPMVPCCRVSGLLCAVLTIQAVALPVPPPEGPALNIVIIEGDGAINNIKQRVAREPIVEVQDENHKPIAGAAVLFELPQNGAGGTFAQGAHTATFTTDANGRAVAHGFHANKIKGKYQIKVTASSQGRTASVSISQTNALAAGTLAGALSLKTILIVTAAGAAGIAGGIYAATHGGGKSSTTITPGSPGVGAPK